MIARLIAPLMVPLAALAVTDQARSAPDPLALTLSFEAPHWLVIRSPRIPGEEIRINYLEAYCRAGSTDADWVQHTVITHRTELVSLSDDRKSLRLRDTLADGVTVEHAITAGDDEVDFRLVAHNPGTAPSQAHWAQPCVRLAAFTGFDPKGKDLDDCLTKCFIFLEGKLTRMSEIRPWAKEARYTPGQVWCPKEIPRTDVNPRPLSPLVPSNGLIGAFSGDETLLFATAWEPCQELFQGIARCLHADFRIGGIAPGETKRIHGKIYIVPPDIPALLKRYEKDFAPASPKGLKTKLPPGYTIPIVDISEERQRQVVVDREAGQYLGHPTTVLLEDNRTMLAVYPKGHGRGAIVYKRSTDAGKTWGERLPTPGSWETSLEVPTLHRVADASGNRRIILFSGLFPIRMAVTEDDGARWSELEPIGEFGGVVTMATVLGLKTPGHYLAFFHDDGRFIRGGDEERFRMKGPHSDHTSPAAKPWRFWVYTTLSKDGGLTWSVPAPIAMLPDANLCEPGALRSPDGKQIAVLLRENSRKYNSFVIFSDDEGLTWTEPRELPAALTGDRHVAKYAPDGRLFISFRDTTHVSPTKGDWVGWVGTYDDIVQGREGQYRVRIMDNTKGSDCTYPGVEVLPDGTFVTTTYGHWTQGEPPYIVSVRFTLQELDAKRKPSP